jgi:hypothetical protein
MVKLTKIRIFWLILLAFLVIFFLFFKVVPFGHITYRYVWPRVIGSGQGFISDFKPQARLDSSVKRTLKIVADPVYFSLFTPRRFDKATVTIKYRRQLDASTPIVELGLLQDKFSGRYELKPLENRWLDNQRFNWRRLSERDGELILQVDNYYEHLDDFWSDVQMDNLKDCQNGISSCLAVYNYNLQSDFKLANYRAAFPITIDQPLRGTHQFYVYLTGGDWRFQFSFVDLNQDREADPIEIVMFSGSQLIAREAWPDLNLNPTGGPEEPRSLVFQGGPLPTGVYKVEIRVSDDVVIKSLRSPSEKVVFINHIWPVSSLAKPLEFWTDGSYLQAQTLNPSSLGDIVFGEGRLSVSDTYQQFSTPVSDYALRQVKSPHDDLMYENNGVFSFSAASFFNPGVKKIDRYFKPGDQIKYIIANYSVPDSEKEWRFATAEFDLRTASRDKGKYTFLFSIPGLALDSAVKPAEADNYLEIKEIEVKLQGKTLWQKIRGR